MALDLNANKEKFIQIYKGEIQREGADELLAWLCDERNDFFTAPHTGQYTLSCAGGLCQHALDTFRIASMLKDYYRELDPDFLLDPEVVKEKGSEAAIAEVDISIAIASLLHDIGDVNSWVDSVRNVQQPDGKWLKVPCYKFDEEFIYGHGAKAVFIIQQFMPLYVEEAQAIRFHSQGHEIRYGNNFEDTYYAVYDTNSLAAFIGAAVDQASNVLDRIIWAPLKPQV